MIMSNVSQLVPNTNLKLLDVKWFSGTATVGIVLVEDMSAHYTKAYIGVGQGFNEVADALHIAQWGGKITKKHAEVIFGAQPNFREN